MNLSVSSATQTTAKASSQSTAQSTADSTNQATAPAAAERVLAAELQGRGEQHDALSMMMSSMVRMVQAGQSRDSRWQDA